MPLLADVGLPAASLEHRDNRIPYAAMGRLLHECERRSGCPHFALLAGRAWHLSELAVVGEMVRNSPTLGSALRTFAVYQHLHSDGGLVFLLERDGGVVDLGYAIYHPDVIGADHIHDVALAVCCNYVRELCGAHWAPLEVLYPHAKPADVAPHQRFFRAPLRFDSVICALRFRAQWMARPIGGADPARFRSAEIQADQLGPGAFVQQVARALRILLLSGTSSGDGVAQALAMHRRTLNRHLKAHGLTFQQILDDVRSTAATQLLADSAITLDDIAATLAYSGVSPFMRAFKGWTGTTPGNRRRAVAGSSRRRIAPHA